MSHILNPLLRKLESVGTLSTEESTAILELPVTIRQMRADHDIVRDRDRPTQCCLVIDGWLCRYKILENGTRQIFSFHVAGDIPDLQSLHLQVMDHNLGSLVQSTVAFMQHDSVRTLCRNFPHVCQLLWRDTLIDAAIFREWIVGMGRRDAPSRIAHLFCELFVKMRAVGLTRGNICDFPITQSVIGDALGLSTVHVNRSLMELRGRGLISLEKHTLTILKWDELQEEGGFDPLYLHLKVPAEAAA
jgi:CRP-like cAMP-binding protein